MILEYKIDESKVEAAWLKTLYDLVEELNCKCQTYINENYSRAFKQFTRTRVIEVQGSSTMLSWFKLRMERYSHFIACYSACYNFLFLKFLLHLTLNPYFLLYLFFHLNSLMKHSKAYKFL